MNTPSVPRQRFACEFRGPRRRLAALSSSHDAPHRTPPPPCDPSTWTPEFINQPLAGDTGRWAAFRLCGYAGLALAVSLALTLTVALGRSVLVMVAIVATAVATFLALAMVTKVMTGQENLTSYHHQVAVLATATLLLAVTGQPILAYLDQTALGVGLFLASGRVGCLLVGCCYGRPASWGVRYREPHGAAGFPAYLVGVRLFPVQAAESLWVLVVVALGTAMLLAGTTAGVALAWYLSAYPTGRFFLELLRGDLGRRHLLGFSEAQWTSVAMALAVLVGPVVGLLPSQPWGFASSAIVIGAMSLVVCRSLVLERSRHLLRPNHVHEIAQTLATLPIAANGAPDVHTTSLELRVSQGWAAHYALSSAGPVLDTTTVRRLARLIVRLRCQNAEHSVVEGHRGVFHVIVSKGM